MDVSPISFFEDSTSHLIRMLRVPFFSQMPFGPYKLSGYGQELGKEALENFSKTKMVYMEMGDVREGDTSF